MTNLDSILKSRDITLPIKVRLVKAMIFPVVMYECESWTINKAERQRIDAFELWCWRWVLRVPWTAAYQVSLSIPKSQNLSKLMSISRWCYPTISSSVVPFSSHLQSFPASGFFPMSQFFASGVQTIGISASASVLPMNIQDWFFLAIQGILKSLLQHHSLKASIL